MAFSYPGDVWFECSGCGLCCGDTVQKKRCVLLLDGEVKKISGVFRLSIDVFAKKVLYNAPYFYEMRKFGGQCFFLKENRCSIYAFRPLICRFYPFELRFDSISGLHVFDYTLECPVINKKGKLMKKHDFEELFLLAKKMYF
ncbi:MAG: YkgJ family cysteine cluster protein [Nitrososphaerota archaeon]|jgi:Fe-S-cluster containining protein|nr:YkgJ family cysteine cluster protein [Nitrososphaerota archaeon]